MDGKKKYRQQYRQNERRTRNDEVRDILDSREIAKLQNAEQRRKSRCQALDPENLYLRDACWPTALRTDKVH